MNIATLQRYIVKEGITFDLFQSRDETLEGGYCINNQNSNEWEVYRLENGLKKERKIFHSENAACIYIKDLVDNLFK